MVNIDGRQYLITARHVVQEKAHGKVIQEIKDGDRIEIFFEGAWVPKVVRPIFAKNEADAVALAPDSITMPGLDIPLGTAGIALGQKVFFLGLPFSLASRSRDKNDFIPFVKAGILSAIDYGDKKTPIVYIDGHNNPGFSGGPVLFPNLAKGR